MTRPTLDEYFMAAAEWASARGTCVRRKVGCVLVDAAGALLSSGYNGAARGRPHCTDSPCPGAGQAPGEGLDLCDAVHAEQNALLFCRDVSLVYSCYSTAAPCATCAKLLLNTGCMRVVFRDPYPGRGEELWRAAGREWAQFSKEEGPMGKTTEELGHRTRFSDSSLYDEVCVLCGATDSPGDSALGRECLGSQTDRQLYDRGREAGRARR